ncbi:MAG: RimK family protein [Pseudomonadota bacterium]
MPRHILVTDRKREDLDLAAAGGAPGTIEVMSAQDFIRLPLEAQGKNRPSARRPRVINLCWDYDYLSLGYYCSLLAEARGLRVIPSVNTMLDLNWKRIWSQVAPNLHEALMKAGGEAVATESGLSLVIIFGRSPEAAYGEVARRLFDSFRCPILKVRFVYRKRWEVAELEALSPTELDAGQRAFFSQALDRYTRAAWHAPKTAEPAKHSIAILHDPKEGFPPSNAKALDKFTAIGAAMGIEVKLIGREDISRLAEFDALFIRETTAVDNHTYRAAKKAEAEGLVVIDDPGSILRCCNKVYLAELLQANGVPAPQTTILDKARLHDIAAAMAYPVVVKIPDGSFSRGVEKAGNAAELKAIAKAMFEESDIILAQAYVETKFDWRILVLNRRPLVACKYFMARGHWQIYKHDDAGATQDGAHKTLRIEEAPYAVVDTAVKAANLMGDGLYGVDLKETTEGPLVIEVNDNPNIDAGVEDAVLKDALYKLILSELVRRIEAK